MSYKDKTPQHIRLDERNHVEKPLLDQLHGLGWEIIDLTEKKQQPGDTFRQSFTEVVIEPMLRASLKKVNDWLEEDQILSQMGKPRLHTTTEGYFRETYLWDLLIRRIVLEYTKRASHDPQYHEGMTTVFEFARGTEHGGFHRALSQINDDILGRAAVLYIDVSYEESFRKNIKRFNPDRPYSILEHSLPEEKMRLVSADVTLWVW